MATEPGDPERSAAFQSLVEVAGSPIVCLDAAFHITVFNRAAERAFGVPRETAVGQPYPALLPEPVRDKVASDLRRVLRGETIEQFENVIRRADGAACLAGCSVAAQARPREQPPSGWME